MGYAYALSPGKERDSALSSIKIGYKECNENLARIESELESSSGTILIEMKGIQGFARICPGDVFEITVKYGPSQKWKTKGKILKDGINQFWENDKIVFRSLLGEVLNIKAVEVRGLGKNVTLGNKLCETKNLFSAHPQLMTINLNAIGTLKLNLVVTWNPLHAMNSESNLKSALSKSSTSLFGSMRSLPTLFGGSTLSIGALGSGSGSGKGIRSGTLPTQRSSDFLHHSESSHGLTPTFFSTSGLRMKKSKSAIPVTVKSNSDSTSSGSTSSSLHLTGTTTSSGFGSGSSNYSGCTSMPGSTLTSPDTESAPIILGPCSSQLMSSFASRNKHLNHFSSSTSNLTRVDSALYNKTPRVVKHNQDVMVVSADVHSKNAFNHHKNHVSSHNKQRFFERSYQDIIEVVDENCTDCSSELTESTPSLNSPMKQTNGTTPLSSFTTFKSENRVNSEPKLNDKSQQPSSQVPPLINNSTSFHQHLNKSITSFASRSSLFHQGLSINLSDTLINLISALEDIQGQYSETQSLQVYVQNLFKIIKSISSLRSRCRQLNKSTSVTPSRSPGRTPATRSRRSSGTSDFSFQVESALECFDFLNSAISDNDGTPESSPEHERYQNSRTKQQVTTNPASIPGHSNGNHHFCDEETTSFMSVNHQVNPYNGSSMTPSPVATPHPPFSTGSEQLDLAIMSHLSYCQKMLENLGSFGPLKQRELKSLEKLLEQSVVIAKLCQVATNIRDMLSDLLTLNPSDDILKTQTIRVVHAQKQEETLSYLREDVRVLKLWDTVTYQCCSQYSSSDDVGNGLISVSSKQFSQSIESYIKAFMTPTSSTDSLSRTTLSPLHHNNNINYSLAGKVAKLMTTRVVDAPKYEPDFVVTSFQLHLFFNRFPLNLEQLFKSFTDEVLLLESLKSGDAIEVKQSLNKYKRILPPKEPLFSISLLLLDRDPLIARIAETYFLECSKIRNLRNCVSITILHINMHLQS